MKRPGLVTAALSVPALLLLGCAAMTNIATPKPLYDSPEACEGATGWSERTCSAVLSHSIFVGMTADQVRASWGEPSETHDTTTAGARHEQWVYNRGEVDRQYVYLDNGIVTATQD